MSSQCNWKGKTNKQTLDKIIEVGYWKRETSVGPKREESLILVSSQRRTALEPTSVFLYFTAGTGFQESLMESHNFHLAAFG